jgi:hypothetical protein
LTAVVYSFSLVRGPGFWDTGELQTVPYILGLAHPTGYPAEIVAGWLFTHALPFGEPAVRMNLFCMLCVVVATWCCCGIALLLGADALVAFGASLVFAFAPVTWAHATHADVTDPALALCALVTYFALLAVTTGSQGSLVAAAVFAGAAFGTHGMIVWFLPLPLLLVLVSRDRRLLVGLPACALLTIGVAAAFYVYMPLRSAYVTAHQLDPSYVLGLGRGMPFWDLGHPATWQGFIDIATGRNVGATQPLWSIVDPRGYPHDVAFALAQASSVAAWPLLIFLALAAVFAAARSPRVALFFLPAIMVTPFAANFANESDVSRYYTFPLLCLCAAAAAGLTALGTLAPSRAPTVTRLVALALVGITAYEAYAGRGLFVRDRDSVAADYADRVIASSADNAVLIADWVYATPLAYAMFVRHAGGHRVLVTGAPEEFPKSLQGWMDRHTVFAIAEAPPHVKARVALVRELGINPGPHDPKLYRLHLLH